MSLPSKRQVDQHRRILSGRGACARRGGRLARCQRAKICAGERRNACSWASGATTAKARRLIAEGMPRLAVVDVNLKREMASGLIEELHDQGVSVVVVSGYALPPVSVDKAAAFLQKPFSGSELLTALRRVVAQTPESSWRIRSGHCRC